MVRLRQVTCTGADNILAALLWLFLSPHRPKAGGADGASGAERASAAAPDVAVVCSIVDACAKTLQVVVPDLSEGCRLRHRVGYKANDDGTCKFTQIITEMSARCS